MNAVQQWMHNTLKW